MRRLLAGLALAAFAAASAQAGSALEHRLTAEIAVMHGDLRRLAAPRSAIERDGLVRRIRGALAALPLLMRQARDADPRLPAAPALADLRAAIESQDWTGALAAAASLARAFPFDAARFIPLEVTPELQRIGRSIHAETCAGCHDQPAADTPLPARDLFKLARTLPVGEFAARLYAGIRGDRLTALANPFGAAELAALIAYYREGQAP